uniref:Calmodulin-lysine N-methyltransferase n=1 Tax=Alexandrium catenella TaxID=2925 RepID=A0A7S1RDW3_ALECA
MTLAACGAAHVLLTDVPRQLPLLERNAEENFPGGEVVQARALDWRVPEHRLGLALWDSRWSVIVGSDVGYDPELFEPLLETLVSQCSPETCVYLALADREEEEEPDAKDFMQAASSRFDCREVYERQLEPFQSTTKVILLKPKASVLASHSG